MQKESLEKFIKQGYSISQLANEYSKSPTTVRYWLKKFDLKTMHKSFSQGYNIEIVSSTRTDTHKYCPACDQWLLHNLFYKRTNRNNELSGWCIICNKQAAKTRQQETKRLAVEYKGGVCIYCGYNHCIAALEFHHLDPSEKDPSWNKMKTRSFESIKSELDKCVLLCSNCHREEHYMR